MKLNKGILRKPLHFGKRVGKKLTFMKNLMTLLILTISGIAFGQCSMDWQYVLTTGGIINSHWEIDCTTHLLTVTISPMPPTTYLGRDLANGTIDPANPFTLPFPCNDEMPWAITLQAIDVVNGIQQPPEDFWVVVGCYMPLELIDFTGSMKEKNTNELNWTTATEENTAYFIVEKSSNGMDFKTESEKIKAAGNSTTTKTYQWVDNNSFLKNYYRLQMVDLDGKTTYSKTILVEKETKNQPQVEIFPNPTSDFLFINYSLNSPEIVQIEIYNTTGQLIESPRFMGKEGLNQNKIAINEYEKGIYFVKIQTNHSVSTKKLIKN